MALIDHTAAGLGITMLIFIFIVLITSYEISAKLFCPPLKAPENTNLTCELPNDKQKLHCSSSWLPDGTIAHFQCVEENGDIRKGRIRCNGNKGFSELHNVDSEPLTNSTLPCGLFEDRSAPEFHIYGYKKPRHFPLSEDNYTNISDFRTFGLKLHNSFRKRHGAKKLVLDDTINQKAQLWAEHLAKIGMLNMASEPSLGQNIFNSDRNNEVEAINDAVKFWYNDGLSKYNWTHVNANWDNPLALDFSQIVWKSTQKVGLGAALQNTTKGTIIVVFYSPMGNIVIDDSENPEKLFIENVVPIEQSV